VWARRSMTFCSTLSHPRNKHPAAAFPFTAQPGLHIPLSADARPVEFFNLFFGDDTMELLVEETNRSKNSVIIVQIHHSYYSKLHL